MLLAKKNTGNDKKKWPFLSHTFSGFFLPKNWIFDNPFHKKGPVLSSYFGASDDQTIRIRRFFEEIGPKRLLRPVSLQRPLRSMRLERFLRPGKSLLRTSESSLFLNSII